MENKACAIIEIPMLYIELKGNHVIGEVFTITNIVGPENVIIGVDWLEYHNLEIN